MATSSARGRPASPDDITVPRPGVRTTVVVRWGMLAWLVALAVLLLVPSLRAGDRAWWVWVPVAGLVCGAAGLAHLRRGRGNARLAE